MKVQYSIDSTWKVVFTTFAGPTTRQDVEVFCRDLSRDPSFDASFSELSHIAAGSLTGLHYEDLDQVRKVDPFSAGSRRALVADAEVDYGIARMYEMMHDGNIQVFRTLAQAKEFLGLAADFQKPMRRSARNVGDG